MALYDWCHAPDALTGAKRMMRLPDAGGVHDQAAWTLAAFRLISTLEGDAP